MDKICIAQFGSYNLPSLGDTMFPAIFADNMRKIVGKDNVEIDIYSPEGCDKPYNDLPKVYGIDELEERNKQKHYDAFVLGGGEFIHFEDVRYKTVDGVQREYAAGELWLKPTRMAHALGIPVYWEGVGVGYDFVDQYQRKTIREACGLVKRITVRDKYAAQRLLDAGVAQDVYVAPDMLWMFKNSIPTEELDRVYDTLAAAYDFLKKPYMVVQYATEYRCEEVAKEAVAFSEANGLVPVSLVVNYCHDDTKICRKLTEYDPAFKTVDRMLQPVEIMAIIYKAKFFWGSSFHGNLISMLYGVPNILLDMYPNTVSKMDGLMSWLDCTERRCILPDALGRVSDEILRKDDICAVKKQAYDLCDREYAHIMGLARDIMKQNAPYENDEKAVAKECLSYKAYLEAGDDFRIAISIKRADGALEFTFKAPVGKNGTFVFYSKECSLINVYCDGNKLVLKNGGTTLDKGTYIRGRSEFALPEVNSDNVSIIVYMEKISFDEYVEALKQYIKNKEGHIEQLLQSERSLLGQLNESNLVKMQMEERCSKEESAKDRCSEEEIQCLSDEIVLLKQEILNLGGQIEQLSAVERDYQRIIHCLSWRIVSFPGKVIEFIFRRNQD